MQKIPFSYPLSKLNEKIEEILKHSGINGTFWPVSAALNKNFVHT